jgi:hypothetical protein
MKYINAQNVKALAKEYGTEYREQETRIGGLFLHGIDALVEQVVMMAVRAQDDDERMTLQSCEWMERQIKEGLRITAEAKGE